MRDAIDMAREAGWKDLRDYDSEMRNDFFMGNTDSLKALVELARADERDCAMRENAYVQAEREACAKLVEDAVWFTKFLVAKAIRARGNT